jgi:hypothetical protein
LGSVWKPDLGLGNALFDALDADDQHSVNLDSVHTTSFRDPIFGSYRKVWIDHVLYSKNKADGWIGNAEAKRAFAGAQPGEVEMIWSKYPHASDHHPVIAQIDSDLL